MVEICVQHSLRGDKPKLFFVELPSTTLEERDRLANEIENLRKQGFALFLMGSDPKDVYLVRGYDKKTHSWLLNDPAKKIKKMPVKKDAKIHATAPNSGG